MCRSSPVLVCFARLLAVDLDSSGSDWLCSGCISFNCRVGRSVGVRMIFVPPQSDSVDVERSSGNAHGTSNFPLTRTCKVSKINYWQSANEYAQLDAS